jgi:SAM-dependent methyltransferase
VVSRAVYDFLYRRGAPWEGGPRAELVRLVTEGRLSPEALGGDRAVDLGCGSGANAIFLAEHGFDVTGVDFSPVALAKAGMATPSGVRLRFVEADLTASTLGDAEGVYDLLVDYGTLDDFKGARQRAVADTMLRLSRSGSVFCCGASTPRVRGGAAPERDSLLGD